MVDTVCHCYEITGHPSNATVTKLKKKISQLTKDCECFKIGSSVDIEKNRKNRYSGRYKNIYSVYRTNSIDNMDYIEWELTDYYMEKDSKCQNRQRAGGPPLPDNPPFYVYLALG